MKTVSIGIHQAWHHKFLLLVWSNNFWVQNTWTCLYYKHCNSNTFSTRWQYLSAVCLIYHELPCRIAQNKSLSWVTFILKVLIWSTVLLIAQHFFFSIISGIRFDATHERGKLWDLSKPPTILAYRFMNNFSINTFFSQILYTAWTYPGQMP